MKNIKQQEKEEQFKVSKLGFRIIVIVTAVLIVAVGLLCTSPSKAADDEPFIPPYFTDTEPEETTAPEVTTEAETTAAPETETAEETTGQTDTTEPPDTDTSTVTETSPVTTEQSAGRPKRAMKRPYSVRASDQSMRSRAKSIAAMSSAAIHR